MREAIEPHDPAVYLHSGGTTGTPENHRASSHNMNVLAVIGPQIVNIDDPFEKGYFPAGLSMAAISSAISRLWTLYVYAYHDQ